MAETKPNKDQVVLNVQVGLEEVAAIKVADTERKLLIIQEETLVKIEKLTKDISQKNDEMIKAALDDAREEYPEIGKIEELFKSLLKKDKSISLSVEFDGEKISVGFHGAGELPWKGEKSHALKKEIENLKKELTKAEDARIDAKKKLSQLAYLERAAKAEVAKIRLAQTKEGRDILSQIRQIDLPGLPAPK